MIKVSWNIISKVNLLVIGSLLMYVYHSAIRKSVLINHISTSMQTRIVYLNWHFESSLTTNFFLLYVVIRCNHLKYPTQIFVGPTIEISFFLIFPLYFSEFPLYILRGLSRQDFQYKSLVF